MVSLLAIAFQLPLSSFATSEVKQFPLINAKNPTDMFFPFVFFFSKLNLVLVSGAKMTALQPGVLYSAKELVLAHYEQGMLCLGWMYWGSRNQTAAPPPLVLSGAAHGPSWGRSDSCATFHIVFSAAWGTSFSCHGCSGLQTPIVDSGHTDAQD